MTFLAVEKRIASSLRERVQTTADTINADDVRAIATRSQAGHWASLDGGGFPGCPRQALHAVYDALVAAADFYALRNLHKSGFDYPDAASNVPGIRERALPLRPALPAFLRGRGRRRGSKAGTLSSRCGPTSRPIMATGI